MHTLEILSVAASIGLFVVGGKVGASIARDVSEKSGTEYKSLWDWNGKTVWDKHKALYPESPKRGVLIRVVIASFGFLLLAGLLGR